MTPARATTLPPFPAPRHGYGSPSDPASQQAAALLQVDAGVNPTTVALVVATIETSPKTVIAALNKDKPTIRLSDIPLCCGASGFFDPATNLIFLNSDPAFLKEITEHELAHVWDYVNHITGGFGSGGAVWRFRADHAFRRRTPGPLGFTVGLVDPPIVDGVGSGDVMAEMVAFLSHDDESGNGTVMARVWPELSLFLVVALRLSY